MLLRPDEATTMATPIGNGDAVAGSEILSWSSETNWTVSSGSIDGLITVESLDSPIDSDSSEGKSPVVLVPPSSDSGPCEIKIKFSQKHEVRQVYVRSTARIFEIYMAPSLSSNEYLCTVRCGMAARDDEVLHATQTGENNGANSNGSAGEQGVGRNKDNGNIPANEDGWIEVKVPDSSSPDNQHNSMPRNVKHSQEASSQELYEATAEITDADACISLTLRLLSLQTKDWVYVDEIYVFADPVDPTDTENQVPEVGSSAGTSSLMAMLVPTLLNLSKTGNIQRQSKQTFDLEERDKSPEVGIHVPSPTESAIEIKQEVLGTEPEVNEVSQRSPHLQIPGQAADAKIDGASNVPNDQIARTLELLLSRVSRIEDICSSFEQSMLKPISSIERRLQTVEEQLQMLSKNPQHSAPSPRPSTRIVAPPFSCTETDASAFNDEGCPNTVCPLKLPPCSSTRVSPSFSCSGTNSNSLKAEGNNYPACGALQSKKDSPVEVSSNACIDLSIPVPNPRFVPRLVVTAPEFSCGDDDDESDDDDIESSTDCPREIKKQSLSVDDALAAALAGFISATSVPPSSYIQTLAVKAPEFVVDEDDSTSASPSGQNGQNVVLDPPRHVNDSATKQRVAYSRENFLEDTLGVTEKVQFDGEDTRGCSLGISIDCQTTQPELLLAQTGNPHIVEVTSKGEASDVSVVSDSERSVILQQFAGVPIEDTCKDLNGSAVETVENVVEGSEEATSKEEATCASNVSNPEGSYTLQQFPGVPIEDACKTEDRSVSETAADVVEGSEEDISVYVVKSSSIYCPVDFEYPILEVKFASSGLQTADSSVESLLANVPEEKDEVPCLLQRDAGIVIDGENYLNVQEGGELKCPVNNQKNLLLDWEADYVSDVLAGTEDEGSEIVHAIKEDTSSSLI